MRFATGVLLALPLLTAACTPYEGDPVPFLSNLTCETARDGEYYDVTFSFDYEDQDADLDANGAELHWWVDGEAQVDRSLEGERFEATGRIVFNGTGFLPYYQYHVLLQVVDGGGNESNVLEALVDTDQETCTAVSVDLASYG